MIKRNNLSASVAMLGIEVLREKTVEPAVYVLSAPKEAPYAPTVHDRKEPWRGGDPRRRHF